MSATAHLSRLLERAAERRPEGPAAIAEDGRAWSYAELDRAADRLATRLARWGVGRGDRVGLWLAKSPEAVAAVHGVLRSGAAYVPIDPIGPALRGVGILADAQVRAAVVSAGRVEEIQGRWPGPGPLPRLIVVGGGAAGGGGSILGDVRDDAPKTPHPNPLPEDGERGPNTASPRPRGEGSETRPPRTSGCDATWEDVLADDAPSPLPPKRDPNDPAYILFTSGSTGRPKGVVLSHRNAFAFLDWCDHSLRPRDDDRFASHAPFHFDLSTFDLFAACRHAAPLVLIGEASGKDPAKVASLLAEHRVTVWYSAPSILALLAERGGLEGAGAPQPRLVLFAGEVFPLRPLRRLRALWPSAEMWNLYGPTETNVCTAEPIPAEIDAEQTSAFPIGLPCPPHRAKVVDREGRELPAGSEGELLIAGPGVMLGYFGRPDLTAQAFLSDADGTRWYRTGDLVVAGADGRLAYRGRRDRMVKRRGHRVELGEIESALYRHDDVDRAAVVARADAESGTSITAFIALKPGRKGSIIAMKRHCTIYLPHSMIPDRIQFLSDLPATSTDKVDYPALEQIAIARN